MSRHDGRAADDLRALDLLPDFVETAHGSVLFSIGRTRVICTATVQESVPRWMSGRGTGWVTAEYGMLPASTSERKQRDSTKGRPDGRTVEIQRLIGRSLRGVVDFAALGERTVWIDCDVLQADGGTRCAAISGGFVAMHRALAPLVERGQLAQLPFNGGVAAVSAGVVDGTPVLDLDYHEDSTAEVDMNVVMASGGRLIELQGTAEGQPFDRTALDALLELAASGIARIEEAQRAATRLPAPGTEGGTEMRALLATTNAHKARELRSLLGFEIDARTSTSMRPVRRSPRTRCSRRRGRSRIAPAGTIALGEDSGIAVVALGGEPGVRSARFAGPGRRRAAGARCSRAWTASTIAARRTCARSRRCFPTGASSSSRAGSRDALADDERGTAGFGYDPIFVPEGEQQTVAELGQARKDEISHRARAARGARGRARVGRVSAARSHRARHGARRPAPAAPPPRRPGSLVPGAHVQVLDRQLGIVAVELPRAGSRRALARLRSAPGVRYATVPARRRAASRAARRSICGGDPSDAPGTNPTTWRSTIHLSRAQRGRLHGGDRRLGRRRQPARRDARSPRSSKNFTQGSVRRDRRARPRHRGREPDRRQPPRPQASSGVAPDAGLAIARIAQAGCVQRRHDRPAT